MTKPRDSHYTRPAYAADIWFDGASLHIGFPPNADNIQGHTVTIPIERCAIAQPVRAEQSGLAVLLDILRTRHAEGTYVPIAKRGAPIQYQLDGMLKHIAKYDSKNQRITTLADLGLDD